MRSRSSAALSRLAALHLEDQRGDSSPSVGASRASAETSSEDLLIAILVAPPALGEATSIAFARKEAKLRTILERLTPAEAGALRDRLAGPVRDPVGAAFLRLAAERRARVLARLSALAARAGS